MIEMKYKIKGNVLQITKNVHIEDYSYLLKYNMNLTRLVDDIRCASKNKHFKTFLLKAEGLFADEVEESSPLKNPILGNHSIFYYMYGHMIDWVRYEEKILIQVQALLKAAERIDETVTTIRNSTDPKNAEINLCKLLDVEEIGARKILDTRLDILTGLCVKRMEELVAGTKSYLSTVKELEKFDKK